MLMSAALRGLCLRKTALISKEERLALDSVTSILL
jgi:hypothetical protein